VIDPAKVVRTAFEDASVASLLITTEALVADKPRKREADVRAGNGLPTNLRPRRATGSSLTQLSNERTN